jgi:hypothetical protein
MAITTCSEWLSKDSRFKNWGKKITCATHVDLAQQNGYSLTGPWVRWDDSVALAEGEFLVVAAETGSRANRSYEYRLVAGGATECRCIEDAERSEVLTAAKTAGKISEAQFAQHLNSALYSYALYALLKIAEADTAKNTVISDPEEIARLRALASRLLAFATPAEAQESIDAWAQLQALGLDPRKI